MVGADLFGEAGAIEALHEVLSNTRVQDSQASVESDRTAILEMVKKGPGYLALNNSVNRLLLGWIRRVATQVIEIREQMYKEDGDKLSYDDFYMRVNQLQNGRHDAKHRMLRDIYTIGKETNELK